MKSLCLCWCHDYSGRYLCFSRPGWKLPCNRCIPVSAGWREGSRAGKVVMKAGQGRDCSFPDHRGLHTQPSIPSPWGLPPLYLNTNFSHNTQVRRKWTLISKGRFLSQGPVYAGPGLLFLSLLGSLSLSKQPPPSPSTPVHVG